MPPRLSSQPESIEKSKLLLGEGVDEVAIFNALLKNIGRDDTQVMAYDGKDNLTNFLHALRKRPNFSAVELLAVTRDADYPKDPHTDAATAAVSAFQSVCGMLETAQFAIPMSLLAKAPGKPSVTVYILPDCASPGMIEDICLTAPDGQIEKTCLDSYFQCLANSGHEMERHAAAKIQFLAWLAPKLQKPDKMGYPVRDAVQYLNFDHPAFDKLKEFLNSL